MGADIYLGFGSNLGDRLAQLRQAAELLEQSDVRIVCMSSVYESAPVGPIANQPNFLNSVARVNCDLLPEPLLELCLTVENQLGRVRGQPQGPRTIDIDVLLYGNQLRQTSRLTLPHPRLTERAFVLRPLTEIDPGGHHPQSGATWSILLAAVEPMQSIVHIGKFPRWTHPER